MKKVKEYELYRLEQLFFYRYILDEIPFHYIDEKIIDKALNKVEKEIITQLKEMEKK
jgi:hypothetical protein